MAREGADITIGYLPEEEEDAKWTINEIIKSGRKAHGIAGDIKDESTCKRLIDEHLKFHGKLNVLVNNGTYSLQHFIIDILKLLLQNSCNARSM